ADRAGRGHPLLKIPRLDRVAILAGPDSSITVCLQFHQYLQLVSISWVLLLRAADLFGRAGQQLDVVAVFVRHHVVTREIAARAELALHGVVEAGVDVDALVRRAVERADRGRG